MPTTVIIPKWERFYVKSKKTMAKYWLAKDVKKLPKKHKDVCVGFKQFGTKRYCVNEEGERFLKNSKKAGTPNIWVLNGQDLYNGTLHPLVRSKMAKYYHAYFSKYIKEQLKPTKFKDGYALSISVDIYEVRRGTMPDVSNMWPLEKFFEDALQDCGIIPDDNPTYVIESGRKQYHWVENEDDRMLIFNLELIKVDYGNRVLSLKKEK